MKSNVENMLDMFTQIRKVYVNEFGKLFPEENFSPNEIDVLIFLSNNPSINTNRQLSLCLNVSKGLICRSTDSLFRRGLLAVTPDSSDSRIQHLSLTEQADSIIRDLQYARRKLEAEVLHDIPKEELLQLQETAEKILNRFQEKAKMQETLQKQKDGK